MDPVHLESDRLILRPLRRGDEEQIMAYANYEENWKYTLVDLFPYYREHAEDFISRSLRGWEVGDHFIFGIHHRTEGRLIGAVDLRLHEDRCAEIGYLIEKPMWGQGIVPEAVRLVLGFSFGPLKLHRIEAGIFSENPRSMRVLEKLGFTREGVSRERYFRLGRWMDAINYAILDHEFDGSLLEIG